MAAETIREKAFRLLGDELPYGVAVTIDKWTETEEGAEIIAGLIVERESHKAIVIGEKGGKLRESRVLRAPTSRRCSASASTSKCGCACAAAGPTT